MEEIYRDIGRDSGINLCDPNDSGIDLSIGLKKTETLEWKVNMTRGERIIFGALPVIAASYLACTVYHLINLYSSK